MSDPVPTGFQLDRTSGDRDATQPQEAAKREIVPERDHRCGSRSGGTVIDLVAGYRLMVAIRSFEERLPELYQRGLVSGTGHLCLGQEATAAGVGLALRPEDAVFSNHRGHGHYLAATGDLAGLLNEILGTPAGVCAGVGGTQHLCAPRRFYSNGLLGGMTAVAAGYAQGLRARGSKGLAVVFLGDGAWGEGIVYESLNVASLWGLPLLLVVEDNGISQSTPKANHMAGDLVARPRAFGIRAEELESVDLAEVAPFAAAAAERVRASSTPECLVIRAPRRCGHSVNSSGPAVHRPEDDPLVVSAANLAPAVLEETRRAAEMDVSRVFDEVLAHAG